MGLSFGLIYKPSWEKRLGKCNICQQGIVAGTKIMLGKGFFNGYIIETRQHFECWLEEVPKKAEDWFFKNPFEVKAMDETKRAELNRLRVKRRYIIKKGGEPNEVELKLKNVEQKIALVKAK